MPNENNYLDITLLGREYRVACPPAERESLLAAVAYVDARMREIAEKTRSNVTERIAVMAALNIAHELLSQTAAPTVAAPDSGREKGLDIDVVKGRIADMEAQLDSVLAPLDESA